MSKTQAPKTRTYDVVVIGGGAVGENVADRAVRGGLNAVVIERALVGGECSYWACMPSKALLRPGAAQEAARAVPGAGRIPEHIDSAATLASRTAFTSNWDDASQVEWLDDAGIDLIRGEARIVAPREVEVTSTPEQVGLSSGGTIDAVRVKARVAVVLCTGSTPTIPPVDGLGEIGPWTSAEATSTDIVPEDLLIIGGGVIACEMATAFADLGSRVHLIVRGERLLASMDSFVGAAVARSLEELGVDVRFTTEVTSCQVLKGGASDSIVDGVTVLSPNRTGAQLSDGSTVVVDQVLVATGRTPRLPEIGIDVAGNTRGKIELDDQMRVVGTDWLYAVGDASGRAHTTHQGKYQARIIGDFIVEQSQNTQRNGGHKERVDLRADALGAPQVVFTRPEVTHVGLTATQARERDIPVQIYDQDLGSVAGAVLHAKDYAGQVRFVVDERSQVLVGVTTVGADTAEMLHAATIAIVGRVPLAQLWHAVPAYPTMSEVWLRFLESAGL